MDAGVLDGLLRGALLSGTVEAVALSLCQYVAAALQFCDSSFYAYHIVFLIFNGSNSGSWRCCSLRRGKKLHGGGASGPCRFLLRCSGCVRTRGRFSCPSWCRGPPSYTIFLFSCLKLKPASRRPSHYARNRLKRK